MLCGCAAKTVQSGTPTTDEAAASNATVLIPPADEPDTATTAPETDEASDMAMTGPETGEASDMAMTGPETIEVPDSDQADSSDNRYSYDRLLELSVDEITYLNTSYIEVDGSFETELNITDRSVISEIFTELKGLEVLPKDENEYINFDLTRDQGLRFGLENGDELTVMFFISTADAKHIGINFHGEDEKGTHSYLLVYDQYKCDYTSLTDKCDKLLAPIAKELQTGAGASETERPSVVGINHDGSSGLKCYPANIPSVVQSDFCSTTNKTCYTTFEFALETNKNGQWVTVEPIGELEQENGTRFFDLKVKGRQHCFVDLACYPLLPEGEYRVTKPYKVEGDETVYTAYYRFDLKHMPEEEANINGSITCERSVYPVGCENIKAIYDYNGGFFSSSEVYDVERKENGKWISVRKGSVSTNSIGSGRVLPFIDGIEVDSSIFDLSEEGEYRIRLSVGEMDVLEFIDRHSTLYAYFTLDIMKLEGVSAECTDNELNEMDKALNFTVRNDALTDVSVVKAVIKDKKGAVILEHNVKSYVYSGSDNEIRLPLKTPLSAGGYTVEFSLKAKGYSDATVTVSVNVSKASEEEKNSGVFVTFDKTSYPLNTEKIKFTVENKLYSKKDIMLYVAGCYKDDAPVTIGMPLWEDEDDLIIKYGEKKTFTLTNYGTSYEALKNYYNNILGGTVDDGANEYLDELLNEIWAEIGNDPEVHLGVGGEYSVLITYAEINSGNSDFGETENIEARFTVK